MIKSVSMERYEQFSHTADIGVRIFGRTLKELFENAAFAMFDIIADLDGLKGEITQDFELTAPNYEELLIAWLDELLYNFYTKSIIFYKFEVALISENLINAKAFGRAVGENRNRLKTEIKAATYYDLKIVRPSDKISGSDPERSRGVKKDDYYEVDIIFDV